MPARPDQPPLAGRTICVLSALLGGDYFGTLVTSVARAASALGGNCLAVQTQTTEFVTLADFDSTSVDLRHVAWERADAFVVILRSVSVADLQSMREAGRPIVVMSDSYEEFACPVVRPDNRTGARQALLHLVDHGHTRIGFVGDLRADDVRERYETYKEVLAEHGLAEFFFPAVGLTTEAGRACGEAFLEAGAPCTAVFASCDHNALGLMEVVRRGGLRLPNDLAVVGFDDMPGAGLHDLPLSTVRQDFAGMAEEAVRLVAEQLSGREVAPAKFRVPTALVVRESCGCCTTSGAPGRPLEGTGASPAPLASMVGPAPEPGEVLRSIEAVLRSCATSEVGNLAMIELKQAGQALYQLVPEAEAFSLLGWGHRLAGEVEATVPGPQRPAVRERLARCMSELGAGLARGSAMNGVARIDYLKGSAAQDYAMSTDLLQGGRFDPRSLEWARHIGVGAAVLALWEDDAAPGQDLLRIEGAYGPPGAWAPALGSSFASKSFPPAPVLDNLEDPGRMWMLLPVRTVGRDWGYLAVRSDFAAIVDNQDRYFQWAAMLAQALDHHGLTVDLRRRNEELSQSVEREHHMAQAVKKSEERYALAAKAANDGLWDWDPGSGSVYFSPRWKEMLREPPRALTAPPDEWLGRVHHEDKAALTESLAKAFRGEAPTFEVEHRVRAADGSYLWVLCRALAVEGEDGTVTRLVGSLSDITERRRLQDELVRQALYDNLTSLPNRALFLDRLSQAVAQARRQPNNVFAVLWLDLDGFKAVNDTLGHLAGDQLLVQVAHRLSRHLRACDTAARFGGDEFAILVQYLPDENAALQVAARAQADLSQPYDLGDETVSVTASIGIACSLSGYDRAEDVIRDADIAMYRAKSSGPNRVVMFEPYMAGDAMSRLGAEPVLRKAMDDGQIEMAYQPVLSLATGELWALEAMPVWRGAPGEANVVGRPGLAGVCDLETLAPLGPWAQREAFRQLVRWRAARAIGPGTHVVLRLGAADLEAPATSRQVREALEATGAQPDWVWFEADHSLVLGSAEPVVEALHDLPRGGFTLRMDDSEGRPWSLPALRRLPLTALKIHRDVVARLEEPDAFGAARRIVDIGRELGVAVMAEGVTTPSAQRLLERLGCQFGQGYWFSKPLRGDEVTRALAADSAVVA